jgi:hypothetical protein
MQNQDRQIQKSNEESLGLIPVSPDSSNDGEENWEVENEGASSSLATVP